MTPDLVRVIFERVAYRMVLAGWLRGYSFTAGVGHRVAWRPEGAQKALLLKDLIARFNLAETDNAPQHFHMACKGAELPLDVSVPPVAIEVSAFWLLCVEELNLEDDVDGLLGMVHLVSGWGPSGRRRR